MEILAFLWCESQSAQQRLRECFAAGQIAPNAANLNAPSSNGYGARRFRETIYAHRIGRSFEAAYRPRTNFPARQDQRLFSDGRRTLVSITARVSLLCIRALYCGISPTFGMRPHRILSGEGDPIGRNYHTSMDLHQVSQCTSDTRHLRNRRNTGQCRHG
jgi:hypothetical protein